LPRPGAAQLPSSFAIPPLCRWPRRGCQNDDDGLDGWAFDYVGGATRSRAVKGRVFRASAKSDFSITIQRFAIPDRDGWAGPFSRRGSSTASGVGRRGFPAGGIRLIHEDRWGTGASSPSAGPLQVLPRRARVESRNPAFDCFPALGLELAGATGPPQPGGLPPTSLVVVFVARWQPPDHLLPLRLYGGFRATCS